VKDSVTSNLAGILWRQSFPNRRRDITRCPSRLPSLLTNVAHVLVSEPNGIPISNSQGWVALAVDAEASGKQYCECRCRKSRSLQHVWKLDRWLRRSTSRTTISERDARIKDGGCQGHRQATPPFGDMEVVL